MGPWCASETRRAAVPSAASMNGISLILQGLVGQLSQIVFILDQQDGFAAWLGRLLCDSAGWSLSLHGARRPAADRF